jgi:hypothetical protein
MVLTTKHKVLLWVPCVLFIYLALGNFERAVDGGLAYRVHAGGLVSSILLLTGVILVMKGENVAFTIGIILWALSISLLLFLGGGTLFIIHF